ncbi:hypothetical protein O4215_16885 [Rhodococcus maanshanensis]|uniref:hypothetical protein n=1 Tax=Rhodococcus maanshanensis TaxID=183556 RepID=UPI0022B2F399|nr:hypothetical protein [Rhodococcus maanshanensis]MCZ4557246.1 hypothetical protein [Rhodococcus maanshanensis]
MIDAQTLDGQSGTTTMRTARRWVPGACVWCGDAESVDMYRNEPRCGTCRENEEIIEGARRFLGMYGLRPLGGTLQSDDEEEREWRVTARDARAVLNQIKLETPPDPALVRKALRPRAAAVVAETAPAPRRTTAPKAASSASTPAASAPTTTVDMATLEARVTGLLDQLASVDEQITVAEAGQGLAARARLTDLGNQKASILRMLAALEKTRRGIDG